ncbi:MAG: tetratricopeptide repeat-containing sensor histidine kinase [Imperialibacter sp.]|uniref:tetratricopeptide repeat-containing sensor histidine kinase n=1 Tax=Imperialibacter sp. TaxID=2038411 RepID=UPI0032EF932C
MVILWLYTSLLIFAAPHQPGSETDSSALPSEGFELLLQSSKEEGRADLLNKISKHYFDNQLKLSTEYADSAYNLSLRLGYYDGVVEGLNNLIKSYRKVENRPKVIEYSLLKLQQAIDRRDTSTIIEAYTVIGNNYADLERYKDARYYFQMGLQLSMLTNSPQRASIMSYLGRAYGQTGMYDSGLYYVESALALETLTHQEDRGLSYIYNNLAELQYFKKNYQRAIELYETSLSLPESRKSPLGIAFSHIGLARIYLELKEHEKCLLHSLACQDVAYQSGFVAMLAQSYGVIYAVHRERKDYQKALAAHEQFKLYADSVFNSEQLKFIENLTFSYEIQQQSNENQLLRSDARLKDSLLKQQQLYVWGGSIATVLLLVTSLMLYRNQKQGRRLNSLLQSNNATLEKEVAKRTRELIKTNLALVKQNNQLEQFGFIVAHNLRGPVARILGLAGLIKLENFDITTDKIVIEKLNDSTIELDTVIGDLNTILHIISGGTPTFEEVCFEDVLNEVKGDLRQTIKRNQAVVVAELEAERFYSVRSYIQNIVHNLLSNAIKFRDRSRNPLISVKFKKDNDILVLTMEDNGIGLDIETVGDRLFSPYQRFHFHAEGKGLGLFLVKAQVEALGGTIQLMSRVDHGTSIVVTLPRHAESLFNSAD